MYCTDIKNLIEKINKIQEEITEQKITISSLENEKNSKSKRKIKLNYISNISELVERIK